MTITYILFVLLLLYAAILLFILVGTYFRRISKRSKKEKFFSIIVAARNEERFLPHLLKQLKDQNYPADKYEAIIVSDRSQDKTDALIEDYNKKYENFHHVIIKREGEKFIGKKNALNEGIKRAQGKYLLFTDADCAPKKNWIRSMNAAFTPNVDFIAGYSPLLSTKEGIWNRFIMGLKNLERLSVFTVSAGTLGWNWGVTAAARNMAYRKKVFEQVNGYEGIGQIASGDDDLLLQKISKTGKFKMAFNYDPDSFVPSYEHMSSKSRFEQEKRRGSKWQYYPLKIKLMTGLVFSFYAFVVISFLLAFLGSFPWNIFLAVFLLKWFVEFFFILRGALEFHSLPLMIYFPVAELFYIPYFIIFGLLGTFSKYRWKD